jgi:AcrR family transcriptional regulator
MYILYLMSEVNEKPPLPLRQRQALETRRLIAEAARSLFIEKGYGAATIEAIAARAGVAVSTVYAVFGTKRAVLKEIRTAWHEGSRIKDVVFSTTSEPDPVSRLHNLAHATRRQWETGSHIIAIYRGAAAADSEAAAELAEALKGRRAGLNAFTASVESSLRPGLSPLRAAALVRALCLPEVYEELVGESGWTKDDYERWLATILTRELLPSRIGRHPR